MNAKISVFAICVKAINICYYIICMTGPLTKVAVLVKSVLIDLCAHNFVHAKTCACYLSSPALKQ